jgi:hypothetical protein
VRKPAAAGVVGKWKSHAFAFAGSPLFHHPLAPLGVPCHALGMSAPYFVLVREMRDAYNHRLRLVQSARQQGIKPTARLFQTTVPTVRKWLRRYQQQGPRGLIEVSRAPITNPAKLPPPSKNRSSLCASSCLPSAPAV